MAEINKIIPVKPEYTLVFKGNAHVSDVKLKKTASEELTSFEQKGFRESDLNDAAYQMEIYYRNEGYAFAEVTHGFLKDSEPMEVTFSITEGSQVFISQVTFVDNTAFTDEILRSFFNSKQKKSLVHTRPLFIKPEIDSTIARIKDYYLGNGFLDADIKALEISFSEDRTLATITVYIKEGLQYIIREVDIKGEPDPDADGEIVEIRNFFIGQPYVRRQELTLKSRLLVIYQNLGYAYAEVIVDDQREETSGYVKLIARVNKGPIITISGIEVRGNKETRESFILSRLSIQPETRYSSSKKNESFKKLYETGLFSKVSLNLERRDDGNSALLAVEVVEVPSLELYLEPGWGSYEKLRLKAGLRERSLFGTGLIVNPEAKISTLSQNLILRLTDPWFFNTDITADVPLYYNYRIEPSFARRDVGFGFYLSKALSQSWSATTEYNLRTTALFDLDTLEQIESPDTDYDLGSFGGQVTYNSLDDPFFPLKGKRFYLAAEYADQALGGSITFTRLTGGIRLFFQVRQGSVLGLRYASGFLVPGQDEVVLPISERFFNGGENTVRSFKESELGPKDVFGNPVGGYAYNVINIELRQRIIGNFIGTMFVDLGNVAPNFSRSEQGLTPYDNRSDLMSDTADDFFKGFRPGVGVGVQYLLPIGPLRLDFGFNPDYNKERGENSYVIHFSIGTAF
ncbi:outer membrane protein assembly factor BamA [Thermodesulfobacteriota bacterium]